MNHIVHYLNLIKTKKICVFFRNKDKKYTYFFFSSYSDYKKYHCITYSIIYLYTHLIVCVIHTLLLLRKFTSYNKYFILNKLLVLINCKRLKYYYSPHSFYLFFFWLLNFLYRWRKFLYHKFQLKRVEEISIL